MWHHMLTSGLALAGLLILAAAALGVASGWQSAVAQQSGRAAAISTGYGYTCALLDSGEIACWGSNRQGQRDAPAGRFHAVSAGSSHSCGLRKTGAVTCWGSNWDGQADAPTGRFNAVSAGEFHSCGLRETGAVECWGHNVRGQAAAPAGRFSAISAGGLHSCGLVSRAPSSAGVTTTLARRMRRRGASAR